MLFLGTTGRYLVVRGDRERSGGVVLWDLLSCDPVWTREQGKYSSCLPAADDDQFVLLDAGKKITRIDTFSVASPLPLSKHVVPFGIVQAVVTPAAQAADANEYTGLSRDGKLVRFGAHVEAFERSLDADKKSTGQEIVAGAGVKNQSIWEEMFGKDTFVDVQTVHQRMQDDETTSANHATTREKRGKYSDVFDAPNSSLPPSSLLFDAFVRDFMSLSTRPTANADQDEEPNPRTKVTISAASTGTGAGVRDVSRSTEGRMVAEKEVRGWFTGFIGPRAKAAQAAQKAAAIPATPLGLGKGQQPASTPIGTPTGSASKKQRKVSGKGTPSRAGLGAADDDEDVMVGSKRKKATA